ncbi:MAG TPA: hypothetical protein ENN29_07030 [Candidatus Hydrogenedentes bacterium]|nr:hypothetical protein [Candidatus Hydrogenedentota bacterium]
MPLLQVRGCPEDLYRKVSQVARRQNRTIAQQVVVLLEKGLGLEESNMERRQRLLGAMASRRIADKAKALDPVALIREDRDR